MTGHRPATPCRPRRPGGGVETTREEAQQQQERSERSPEALEAELRALTARIDELERQRPKLEGFAALVAHEMLKPLMIAESYARTVLDRAGHQLDGDSRADLQTVRHASWQAQRLVEALLLEARSGQGPLARRPVDLAQVVRDCVETLGSEIAASRVRVDVGPLPVVPGDRVLLGAVFRNLLANAVEHGSGRQSVVHVACTPFPGGWRFDVDSQGQPIPEVDRERIFEPLRRGPGIGPPAGTGLGLTLVRRLVARHGGEVTVSSPDGHSNRFSFTLPA
jgi:signal transduction histidine kinase